MQNKNTHNLERLWTLDFLFSWIIKLTNCVVFLMLLATVPLICMDEFGSSAAEAGLASGIFVISGTVVRVFAGYVSDTIGRRKSFLASAILLIAVTCLYFIPMNFATLVAIRILHGAVFGWFSTISSVVGTEIVPRRRLAEGTGYYSLAASLTVGQFLGIVLYQNFSFISIFIASLIIYIIQFIFCLFVKVYELGELPDEENEQNKNTSNIKDINSSSKKLKLSNFFDKTTMPYALFAAVATLCYSGLTNFLEPYTAQVGIQQFASWFFFIYTIALFIVRPPMGRAIDRGKVNPIMYSAIIIFGACFVALNFCNNGILLLLISLLLAYGFSAANANMLPLALKQVPRSRLSMATATFFMFVDFGMGIGPTVLGYVSAFVGFNGMFLICAGISVFLLLGYFLIARKHYHSKN
ncbi:MAG: MFS transporter [Coriobacteriales bacterium]|nr:MFS transporter [Coriobacteriales bacterium]